MLVKLRFHTVAANILLFHPVRGSCQVVSIPSTVCWSQGGQCALCPPKMSVVNFDCWLLLWSLSIWERVQPLFHPLGAEVAFQLWEYLIPRTHFFPCFGRQTCKETLVKSVADCRVRRRETYNKEYTLCKTIWKNHKRTAPVLNKQKSFLRNGKIRFPLLP